jgi:hypothetical protein
MCLIEHDPIPIMPHTMTMLFQDANPELVRGLQPGLEPDFLPAALAFGSGIHGAAAFLFRGLAKGARPSVGDVQAYFESVWNLEAAHRPLRFRESVASCMCRLTEGRVMAIEFKASTGCLASPGVAAARGYRGFQREASAQFQCSARPAMVARESLSNALALHPGDDGPDARPAAGPSAEGREKRRLRARGVAVVEDGERGEQGAAAGEGVRRRLASQRLSEEVQGLASAWRRGRRTSRRLPVGRPPALSPPSAW